MRSAGSSRCAASRMLRNWWTSCHDDATSRASALGRVAGGVGGVQDRVGPLHRPDQDGVDEIGAGLEVAVEGDPADARGRGDAGDAHLGIARQAVRGRVEDRGDVAAGVGPLGSRSRHPETPFLNSRV